LQERRRRDEKIFLPLIIVFLFSAASTDGRGRCADFESEFADAEQMAAGPLRGGKDTDYLVKGTAKVLHEENMAILAEIDKLHKEIADLRKEIEDVKDIVEGGN